MNDLVLLLAEGYLKQTSRIEMAEVDSAIHGLVQWVFLPLQTLTTVKYALFRIISVMFFTHFDFKKLVRGEGFFFDGAFVNS